jgi:RNA polymerase sigma-70 factor (ECF subfamily)
MPGLVEKWQTSDTHAFEELFRQHERLVYRTAYLITGGRESAEDVLQDVFVSVWKFRKTYDSEKGKITTGCTASPSTNASGEGPVKRPRRLD